MEYIVTVSRDAAQKFFAAVATLEQVEYSAQDSDIDLVEATNDLSEFAALINGQIDGQE